MAKSARLRRRLNRATPPVRRQPKAGGGGKAAGTLMVGGAQDAAERAADATAARVLSQGPEAGAVRRQVKPPDDTDTDKVKRKSAGGAALAHGSAAAPAPKAAAHAVADLGSGRSLSAGERGYFEPRLGQDLSAVRLHDGPAAHRATEALQARAFAHGTDIAFAPGAASTETMAHELAHVSQDQGGPVRRVLQAQAGPAIDLTPALETTYGMGKGVPMKSGDTYTVGARKDTGTVPEQIAQNLLASPRTFTLSGVDQTQSVQDLDEQVNARQGVVDFARSFRADFTAKKPELGKKLGPLIKAAYAKAQQKVILKLAARGMSQKDIAAWLVANAASVMLDAYALIVDDPKFGEAIRAFRKANSDYDAAKMAGGNPTQEFAMACFQASATVMFGGGQSPIKEGNTAGKTAEKMDATTAAETDWVPGDWGYIKNNGTGTKLPGREGENIISVGTGLFWGHFDPSNPILSLAALFKMVEDWNQKAGISTDRKYPSAGLE